MPHGYILRTSAESASDDELRADIDYLRRLWRTSVPVPRPCRPSRCCIRICHYRCGVLRDFVSADTERLMVDSRETFQKMSEFAHAYVGRAVALLQHYTGDRAVVRTAWCRSGNRAGVVAAGKPEIGGYLIIDQTEAMTTIDVNTVGLSARAVLTKPFSRPILKLLRR